MRAALLCLITVPVFGQGGSEVILRDDFQSATQWTAMGSGSVRVSEGKLQFNYNVKPGQFAAAVLPTPGGVAGMRTLRIRFRTSHPTTVAVLMSEHKPGGGNYTALVWSPGVEWVDARLKPSDFAASDGPNDPLDSDGKLDLDQVEGIGLIDVAFVFTDLAKKSEVPIEVSMPEASQAIEMSGFELLRSESGATGALTIDRFDRGFIQWMNPSAMKLDLARGGLEAAYGVSEGKLKVLIRRLTELNLARAVRLEFDVESEHETTLAIGLETKDGRYHLIVYPPAGRRRFHVSVPLSDFESDGAKRPKVDPATLKMLSFSDATVLESGAGEANRLWFANIEMKDE